MDYDEGKQAIFLTFDASKKPTNNDYQTSKHYRFGQYC